MNRQECLTTAGVTLRRLARPESQEMRVDWSMEVGGIGHVGFLSGAVVVPQARRGRIGIRSWHGSQRSYVVTALGLLTVHLFGDLSLHKVKLQALDTEAEFLSAAVECGFVEEGRRRHAAIVEGSWRDMVHMEALENEWPRDAPIESREFVPSAPTPVARGLPPVPSPAAEGFAVLRGERVTMRRRRPSDRETFYGWLCRGDWWRGWMPADPDGFSPPGRSKFEAEWREEARANEWIVETERGVPIGVCFYSGLDGPNRCAEADVLLYDADYWGRGYGTEAFGVLLKHLFEDLHLHRVKSGTWSGNIGSLRVQQKNGLRFEARGRECYLVDGRWYDGIGTGILEDEYRSKAR